MTDNLPPPPGDRSEPIPISALQHAVYCLRQAALIHLERMWEENRFTAEGRMLHEGADHPAMRRLRGVRRVTALPLSCKRLGIAGVADLVEFQTGKAGEIPYPVEFKRGKPKPHRADEVQLCAQALCLEEMIGVAVPEGALYYATTKRRVSVPMDAGLHTLTEETIAALQAVLSSQRTPPPTPHKSRCRGCSLAETCQPKAVLRSARNWRSRMVNNLVNVNPGTEE